MGIVIPEKYIAVGANGRSLIIAKSQEIMVEKIYGIMQKVIPNTTNK